MEIKHEKLMEIHNGHFFFFFLLFSFKNRDRKHYWLQTRLLENMTQLWLINLMCSNKD